MTCEESVPLLAKIIVTSTHIDQQNGPDVSCNGSQEQILYVELNDIVQIEKRIDGNWFMARSDQTVGKLAKNACKVLDDVVPLTLCQYFVDNQLFNLNVCFASFIAQDVGDLSLTKGDIIVSIEQINEHWMQGQVCFDGQSDYWPKLVAGQQMGTFPLNHCWQLDSRRVEMFCREKIATSNRYTESSRSQTLSCLQEKTTITKGITSLLTAQVSSHSSHAYSTTDNHFQTVNRQYQDVTDNCSQTSSKYNVNTNHTSQNNYNVNHAKESETTSEAKVPLRPQLSANYLCKSLSTSRQKSASEQAVVVRGNGKNIISNKQQDRLKSWIHTVRKKTSRLSTRITASLGLISLTRDEEFEKHYNSFKQLEKTIRVFIKNVSAFVEHYESFLVALQNTSGSLSDFYRDKAQNQREMAEIKKKNKILQCEHFHAFKRTVERQVIAVSSQLLQKFSGPHQLISKRSAKLLDYDTKAKEMDSCRDLEKKEALRNQYVIAKDLYDRINGQLIHELPLFNQFALDIFRECILVLLESRRNLIMAYTQQTATLLDTPLMASYTASDVASNILMSCKSPSIETKPPDFQQLGSVHDKTATNDLRKNLNGDKLADNRQISAGTQPSCSSGGDVITSDGASASWPHSEVSRTSSEIEQVNGILAREISSTPLSHLSNPSELNDGLKAVSIDEPDAVGIVTGHNANHRVRIEIDRISSNGSSDNRHNESIESRVDAGRSRPVDLCSTPAPPNPPTLQAVADSDLDGNALLQLRGHLNNNGNGKSKKKNKKSYPIYIASWPFVATGPNQLTISCNQQVKLIKDSDECGNADWSLVKDKRGQLGYVPSSYIKEYDPNS